MAVEVETLIIKLEARVTDFEKQMARAQAKARTASNDIASTFTTANARIGRVLGVLGISLSVVALTQFVRKTVELGSSISDLSQKLGITAEDFQKLSFAASQTATDQEAVVNGFRGMTQFLTAAAKGGKEQIAILAKLGVSFKDIKNLSPVEVFTLLLDRIGKIQDPLRRNAVLMQVLGRSGASLGALSLVGAKGLEELFNRAVDVGAVMSNETVKTLDQTGDKLDELGRRASVAGGEILTKIIPPLTSMVDAITDPKFQAAMKTFIDDLAAIVTFLVQHPELVGILGGALAGGKIGGVPGAIAGAVLGGAASGVPIVGPGNTAGGANALPPGLRPPATVGTGLGALAGSLAGTAPALDAVTQAAPPAAAAVATVAKGAEKTAAATTKTTNSLQDLINTLPPVVDQFDDWNDLNSQASDKAQQVAKDLKFEGEQLTRTAREQAAFNAVNQAGLDITTAAGAAIAAQARANFDLNKSIEDNKAAMEELGQVGGDALRTIYEGLKAGQSGGEIFNNILGQILDKLANAAIDNFTNALVASLTGGTAPGGGLLGSIFGSIFGGFRQGGGPVTAGRGYVVGEHGREFFVPSVSGRILNKGSEAGGRAAVELVLSPEIDARIRRVAGPQSEKIAFNITRANNALGARTRELKG